MKMVATDDKNLNKFDDDSNRQVMEYTLRKYGFFLHDYALLLTNILPDEKDNNNVWNINRNPFALKICPDESAAFHQLADTDDVYFKEVTMTFATLCQEMLLLREEAVSKFYSPLIFYGEGGDSTLKSENAYMQIGRALPVLEDTQHFVQRCAEVVKNCVQQFSLFYMNEKHSQTRMDFNGAKLTVVFQHICDLFQVLATLDHIIEHQTVLREHWKLYKRMMKGVRSSPETFECNSEEVGLFNKLCSQLESCVLHSKMFEACIKQNFDDFQINVNVSKNSVLSNEWMSNIKEFWTQIEPKLGDSLENGERNKMLGIMCLFIAHYNLFHIIDRKMFKLLWDSCKKIPCVVIAGSSALFPSVFLLEKLPHMRSLISEKALQLEFSNRLTWLQKSVQTLQNHEQIMENHVRSWIFKLESSIFSPSASNFNDNLNEKCRMFLQGIGYAAHLQCSSSTMLVMHASLQKPMLKSTILSVCRQIELMKMLLSSFYRWSVTVSENLMQIIQYITMLAVSIINNIKKQVKTDKKVSKDVLQALSLAEICFSGPATRERIILAQLAVGMCRKQRTLKDDEVQFLRQYLVDIETLSDFKARLHAATNCNFMYWHKVTFPVYLNGICENPFECYRLQYFLQAFEDCKPNIETVCHLMSPSILLTNFQTFVLRSLRENFLDKICKEIETDLRLNMHTHLKLDSQNPFKVPTKHLIPFIRMNPLRVFDHNIDVKAFVEHYLNKTFYNLTTVALHNWRTYSEMKIWANQKFGLKLLEPHLPSQTLEQGLDILEIMRNIHLFVSKYLYNLNNQIFVERSSNNKHLNTINIKHIANSIRTHGIGIMNTAVNFTYQFLTKKFFVFSQFLYDEHIKSRLMKDLRFFKENQVKSNQKYPFERAEKFNRGIKKLGLTNDGLSYLDQFRLLVSEIGNAMGYVRLVRSGGLHCCGNAIRFVPDIDDVVNFEDLCKEDSLSEECVKSAGHFDAVISNMIKHFTEGTEYFKMLVDVFCPEFRNSKNIHLKNFFVILPPLTINFVEHMISSKEKLNKKNKTGAAFTDDGFAMGVAYILKLLDQYNEFDSLHWFQSVRERYQQEEDGLLKQPLSTKDEKLQQTVTLSLKRIGTYQHEFNLLYYSLSSARIFFRAEQTVEEKDEKSSVAESVKDENLPPPS